MTGTPRTSVLICTRDRADSLQRTLESVCTAAERVDTDWEMLVVDNGSSDHTPDVIERFSGRLPIRRVEAPVAGLSNARNRGVEAATGDYLIWTDDDVVVQPDWIAAYLRAIAAHPDAAIFGGRAGPVFEAPVTPWFAAAKDELASLLAIRDEPDWTEITNDRVPYGLNFAIRTAEARAHPFDPELGVAPGRRLGGEEVAVMRAILSAGGTGRWVWDAEIQHMIPPERQSATYIDTFYRAQAATDAKRTGQSWDPEARALKAAPRYLWLQWAKSALGARAKRLAGSSDWVVLRRKAAYARGLIDHYQTLAPPE